MKRLVAVSFLFLFSAAQAAFEEKPVSARSAAMGETGVADAFAPGAWLLNPAALRFENRSRALFAHTKVLGEGGLSFGAAALSFPAVRRGGGGILLSQFGGPLYRERKASLARSFRLAPRAAAGLALTSFSVEMDVYGRSAAWGLDAGFLARPHPRVGLGFAVERLNRPRLSGGREDLPGLTRAGAAWDLSRSARLVVDMVKPRARPFSVRAGWEAAPADGLFVRIGGESRPARYTLGLGLRVPAGRVDYAFLNHPFLGDQHQASFSVEWGRPLFRP